MIVCILEHYRDEHAQVWFCDTMKASKKLHDLLHDLVKKGQRVKKVSYGDYGMQDHIRNDYNHSSVNPPCQVDGVVELWSN